MEIEITRHSSFLKEWQKFCKKFIEGNKAIIDLEQLLKKHFNSNFGPVIGPKSLYLTNNTGDIEMWKVHCAVKGLRKNQRPRIYFFKHSENKISFLCFGTHLDNYNDQKLRDEAISRAKEILDIYKVS
ncbi:MAG: hypothetical protein U9N04_02845 [Patescibacteria group bacterium]|nr:hypothetical protein [Patescibacteria group bacterium]